MFPDPKMAWPAFVHYGKGGSAPAVDNADKYVYLTSYDGCGGRASFAGSRQLSRPISRATIARLDKHDVEYFTGGDGMADANWSKNVADARPMLCRPFVCTKLVYNYAFKRYVMCDETGLGREALHRAPPVGPVDGGS